MDKISIEYEKQKEKILEDHVKYLTKLKQEGFEPKVIYDIGSCILHWYNSCKLVFPNARYILFEANQDMKQLYETMGIEYHLALLSDKDNKEITYCSSTDNVECIGGNSIYPEINLLFTDVQKYIKTKTITIESLVLEFNLPKPDLVKIDVQGAEIEIIVGAGNIFDDSILLCEFPRFTYNATVPDVNYSLRWMKNKGWNCIKYLFSDNGYDGDYAFSKSKFEEYTEIILENVIVLFEQDTKKILGKFLSYEILQKFLQYNCITEYDLVRTYQDKYTGRIVQL